MTSIVFYFQVHQPYRLRRFTYFDIGKRSDYFDDELNAEIARRVAERCYLPMNQILLEAIDRTDGRFRCSFSVSGTALRQLEDWCPEAIESFQALSETGCVEFLGETSHHSLSGISDAQEFAAQIDDQRRRIERLFGSSPTSFRNTELIFDESVARRVADLDFEVLLGEGADRLLAERSSHLPYHVHGTPELLLLLRDYARSDDIAFRFSNREWDQYPLMADTFASWLHETPPEDPFVGLFMDYETFGEHQWADTGILEFMEYLPEFVLSKQGFDFATPGELGARLGGSSGSTELRVPDPISWADAERDLSAWLRNTMQRAAHEALYELLPTVREHAAAGNTEPLETWRKLSTSDHVYYMSTAHCTDGDVHEYFSPYDSPHEAFITFMNVLDDFGRRLSPSLPPS